MRSPIRKKKKNTFSINSKSGEDNSHEMGDRIPSQTLDPEEKIIKKQKIIMMREVVEKLKPHYRTLIELRYFKEYSYEEISETLNLPLGTVKAQLFRAREFLSNILKDTNEKY